MSKITDFLWDEILKKELLKNKRWILLLPIAFGCIYYNILLNQYKQTPFQIMTGSPFIIGVAISVVCSLTFYLLTTLPPGKDKWVLLVPVFHSISDTELERAQANQWRNRIVEKLQEHIRLQKLPMVVEKLESMVDPQDDDNINDVLEQGKDKKANAILCASVVIDKEWKSEDYCFHPYIKYISYRKFDKDELQDLDPLKLPIEALESNLHLEKTRKSQEISDIVLLIASLPFFHYGDFQKYLKLTNCISKKSGDCLNYRAKAFLRLNKLDEAIHNIKKSIALDGNCADSWYTLGLIFMRAKLWSRAIEVLENVNRIQPAHIGAIFHTLISLKNLADVNTKEAKAVLEQTEEVITESNRLHQNFNLLIEGKALLEKKAFHEAQLRFDELIHLDPENKVALNGLYDSMVGQADELISKCLFRNAILLFEKAIILKPDLRDAKLGKIEALWRAGNKTESYKELEQLGSNELERFNNFLKKEGEEVALKQLSINRKLSINELMKKAHELLNESRDKRLHEKKEKGNSKDSTPLI